MTEEQLNELGQIIQRCVPKGTSWIMVMIPPHAPDSHPDGQCPVQTVCNIGCEDQMRQVLTGAAAMLEKGTHEPMFVRPVEVSH
jgi:hypothetical protein